MDLVSRAMGADGDDDSFGPQLGSHFDFTLLFEHAVLTILPTSLCIVASPFYIVRYAKSPVCVASSLLLWAKLAVLAVLLGVEIASLGLWSRLPAVRSDASLAALSLVCVGTLCIVAAVSLEHRHSFRSSALISLYLSLTALLDAVKARSLFLRPRLHAVGGLAAAAASAKLALVLLQEVSKRTHIKDPALRRSLSKEATSGFWNRSLFLWLNSTFLLGFRTVLRIDDLGSLGDDFSADHLSARFEPVWAKYKHSSYALAKSALVTLLRPFLAVIVPRLLYTAFTFSQPLLLRRIVGFLGEDDPSTNVRNGLIGATVLIYFGLAVTSASYNHLNNRLVTLLRGVLVSEIFKKTLAIDQCSARELAAATLMSTDVEGISLGLRKFHDILASIVEVGLGIYLITTIVGKASFLIVFPGIASTIATYEIGRRMAPARIAWNKQVQNRVSVTSSVLQQIKNIKMIGLRPVVADLVQGLRETEMQCSKRFRVLEVIMSASVMLCYQITPTIVMTAAILWTTFSSGLRASETFTALAIVVITSLSMARAMLCYPIFVSTLGCFQRIQTYLLLEERQDRRRSINDLVLSNGYPSEKHASYHSVSPVDKPPLELRAPQTSTSVMFVNASVAAAAGREPLLKGVDVSVSRGKLAVVLGHTGCGKSTFLRAIIGEAHLTDGHVYVERHQVAYCDQTPWLKNVPVRANITGDHAYDKDWYKTVVDACLLADDMQQFPSGDQTPSGDNGSNLSGGQKQRIALARAVYSQASLLVLDNVLSALDRSTADAIFARLFAPGGLLRRLGSTVVMTIHSAEYIKSADQMLVIGDGGSVKSLAGLGDAEQCREDVTAWLSPSAGEKVDDKGDAADEARDAGKQDLEGTSANDELLIRRHGDFRLYSFYLKSTAKWLWAIWLVTVIFVAVAERLPEIFLRIWLDVAPENKVYLVGYILFGFSSFTAAGITLSLYYLKIVPNSAENLHRVLLDKVMGSTLSFLSSTSNGSLLNLFSQDMSLISQDLPLAFFRLLYSFFLLITDIGIIAAGATYISVIIPFILMCVYIIQYFYLRTSRQMRYIDLEAKTPLYTQFSEISAGLMHIRSFGWDSQCLSRSRQLLDDSQKPFYYMFCIQRWLGLVSELCVLGVATILVSVALCFRGTTSQNAMGLSLLTLIQFGDSILTLLNTWIDTETSLGAIARIKSFAETTPSEDDGGGSAELPAGYLEQGAIKMVGVTATYNSDASSTALENVSLDIKPGQKVAVVGRTGSGKSSLLLTILHFLNYTGLIEIDGVDVSQIPRQHLRSRITTIPQDMVELPGTLRDNVLPVTTTGTRPAASHTRDAAISEVLARVRLKEHVDAHGGLDAPLADMGFSHGQKQLLAIARAVLHKREGGGRILLVDEATSAMDAETARVMRQVMDDVFGDCTVIAISHQPGDVESADVVLHVEDGKVT
ncbi:ABC transporter, transmembrane domain, type 1 [Metarhizium robertsii ARSEF 23]|uniref:ABC transporter, transmembrane domain, type 1 n=1 Tax=Metarhizium robertsii (strain ARSEF 23 / ATCC MYA-3075) TaxID=655844 RepID=E9EMS6_METRA|nr:ABC transporter, transmembrane domain, type 1 [Metarhizium robertsii ARSEF 23]EFZ03270.2 ABC transporter, transmembrane domain, type 1 [Metarhizium robertsii ARSEF 23]